MARVVGIGGVFFRSADPSALQAWYTTHLGLPADEDGYVVLRWEGEGTTTWAPFPIDSSYFEPTTVPYMINYRVDDLDEMLAQLRASGVEVDSRIEEHPYGRFGWARDLEGNRFELWEPAPGH